MNKFSVRMSALLLAAGLACASAQAAEVESTTTQKPTAWYEKKSTRIAAAALGVAGVATYAVAAYLGKVKSPAALLAAFTALFSTAVAKPAENKNEVAGDVSNPNKVTEPNTTQPTAVINKDAGKIEPVINAPAANNNEQNEQKDVSFGAQVVAWLSNAKTTATNMKDGVIKWWFRGPVNVDTVDGATQ